MKNAKKSKTQAEKLSKALGVLADPSHQHCSPRRDAIVKAITSAATEQDARSYGYLLAKHDLRSQEEAAAPAIRSATTDRHLSPSERRAKSDPRRSMQALLAGDYKRETLPRDLTELPSQTRMARETERAIAEAEDAEISKLTKELDEALRSTGPSGMQRVAELSYRLSKISLVQGHRTGAL